MTTTINNTGLKINHSYKVPHGQELPFAGRWLTVERIHAGAVDLRAAGGNSLRIGKGAADRLARTAEGVRAA